MPAHVISYIWKYSKWQQLLLIALTFASFPFLYLTLEIPKLIINGVLSEKTGVRSFWGWDFQPLTLLLMLSFSLLGLVVISGLFKIYINTRKGKVGETLIRRLRYLLMAQLLNFPLKHFENMPAGEVSITIVQETDPLAGFAGESFAQPVFQGGTLLTVLLFMFMQDWVLGVASLALVPVQIFIIPRLQRQINQLRKQRIQRVRVLSSRVVETVDAIEEVHIQGTRRYTLAEFSYRFGELYKIRLEIFKKKFFMKFLNNLLGHMTPFLFYAVGGYLILEGRLTIGALVAAIAAHKDFLNPWKELLNYYQSYQDNVVKYQNIIEQFYPYESDSQNNGVVSASEQVTDGTDSRNISDGSDISGSDQLFSQPLKLKGVSLYSESGETLMQNIDLSVAPGEKIAVVVKDNEEARAFARIVSGLLPPSQGEVTFGEVELATIPESPLRQNIGFVTPQPYVFNAALSYNLAYGLNHNPPAVQAHQQAELEAAITAGTSPYWFDETFDCVWTDLARLDAESWGDVLDWIYEQTSVVKGSERMVRLALREVFNPDNYADEVFGDFTERLLSLRDIVQQHLQTEGYSRYVESFRPDEFLRYSSMEENLIFGSCLNNDEHARSVLMDEIAVKLAEYDILEESHSIIMVVLQQLMKGFHNATLSQHIIKKFNLLDTDEVFRLQRINKLPSIAFSRKEKRKTQDFTALIDLFLKIVPADWSGVDFTLSYRKSVVAIRHDLMASLSESATLGYHVFSEDKYNPGLSVMHNVLYGRFDRNCPKAYPLLHAAITDLVYEEKLEANMIQLMIINNHAGVGGNRVPQPIRHTMNLARTLMKKPTVLIMHDALLPLGNDQQLEILNNIKASRPDMSLVWISSEPQHMEYFDQVYQLDKTLRTVSAVPLAQNYPERPLSLLVAYNAGGGTDYQARIITMMAAALNEQNEAKYLGQPLLIVNHAGRGGRDGWNHFVDNAGTEGYELAVYNFPHVIAQAIKYPDKVRYTLESVEPLANWGADPAVFVVSRDSPFRSIAEVLRFAKKHPGKFTLSGAGFYVGHHIAALQFNKATGINARYISGGGGENALKMVVRRQVMAGFNNLSDAYRNRDRVRVLGVADLERNEAFFPDVPTLIEQGIAVDDASVNFRGIMAPTGLPDDQLAYLAERISAMFADKLVMAKMKEAGAPLRIMQREAIREMWLKRQTLIAGLISSEKAAASG